MYCFSCQKPLHIPISGNPLTFHHTGIGYCSLMDPKWPRKATVIPAIKPTQFLILHGSAVSAQRGMENARALSSGNKGVVNSMCTCGKARTEGEYPNNPCQLQSPVNISCWGWRLALKSGHHHPAIIPSMGMCCCQG